MKDRENVVHVCVCVCVYVSIRDGGGLVTKSCPTLTTPRTVACHAPLPMGFSGHIYKWNITQP